MRRPAHSSVPALRPLAAGLLMLCGAAAHAATIPVTNCQNSGAGSLRAAAQAAGNTDVIDLSQLQCSLITLTTGRIELPSFVTVQGPGSGALAIDGNAYDRVFQHLGSGVLTISGLTVRNGSGFLAGGCIYSGGNVQLTDVAIRGCKLMGIAGTSTYRGGGVFVDGILGMSDSHIDDNSVYSALGNAVGGGAYVHGDLTMANSTISGNRADSVAASGVAGGGGAFVTGVVDTSYSTLADNAVSALAAPFGSGGALVAGGRASLRHSTVSGTEAGFVGGVQLKGGNTTPASLIANSTISGNRATAATIGGVYAKAALTVANATIAFNTEAVPLGAGLFQTGFAANLQSSIIARNGGASGSADVGEGLGASFAGANNLIENHGTSPVPADTIAADPRLEPLADNGGRTLTHLLRPGSPAIDAGNNAQGSPTDQRGGAFARVNGVAADIGALETDGDHLFADGFD
ncbi:MAG: choice-of-anchor Q domain-containing protein [Dokdonella sp.]|uniref:choice-of-anchor Q domain-containing protein n=1 Tax=Dokdonella sp. TaxID=2291710 RepID=UPI003F819AEF